MPPAFVLSQDQTLRKINLFYRKIRFKHFYLCCFDYIEYSMSQNEFSRLHRTIQFSISCCFFAASHNISLIISPVKRIFEIFLRFFLISVSFISSGPCGPQRCETLLNISSIFVLSNYFLKIFEIFYQPSLQCHSALLRM